MNASKRLVVTLALAAGLFSTAFIARAAEPAAPPAAGMKEGKGPGPGGPRGERGDRLKHLSEMLGLTEEQKTKIGPILLEEAAALKAIYDDKAIEGPAKRVKAREVADSFSAKVRALLTPDQQAKFDLLPKGRRGPGMGKPGGPGGPDGMGGDDKK